MEPTMITQYRWFIMTTDELEKIDTLVADIKKNTPDQARDHIWEIEGIIKNIESRLIE